MKALKCLFWAVVILFVLTVILSIVNTYNPFYEWWPWPTDEEVEPLDLDEDFSSLTYGKLTPDQIDALMADESLPSSEDVFVDYVIQEMDDYVVLYRKITNGTTTIYPNISFVKTNDNGLVWDGMWGITVKAGTNWWSGSHDNFNHAVFNPSLKIETYNPALYSQFALGFGNAGLIAPLFTNWENIVTFSDFNENYCTDFYKCISVSRWTMNVPTEIANLKKKTFNWIKENNMKNYIINLFDDVSMPLLNNSDALGYVNSLATYLLVSSQSQTRQPNNATVDISHYFNKYIPEAEQVNYPVPAEKQEELGFANYPLFDAKVIANVAYAYDEAIIVRDETKIADYIEAQDPVISPTPEISTITLAKLLIGLSNSNNSDVSQLDMTEKPVTVNIAGKKLIWNGIDQLSKTKAISVELNATLPWTINSQGLVFDSNSGSTIVTSANTSATFGYTYLHNYVPVSVNLIPISSMDTSNLNLTTNPVVIKLIGKNGEGTYNFIFNSVQKLDGPQSLSVKIGQYDWTITSNSLLFNEYDGILDVSTVYHSFNFTFYTETPSGFLLQSDIEQVQQVGDLLQFKMNNETYNTIKSYFNGPFALTIRVYYNDNNILTRQISMNDYAIAQAALNYNFITESYANTGLFTDYGEYQVQITAWSTINGVTNSITGPAKSFTWPNNNYIVAINVVTAIIPEP